MFQTFLKITFLVREKVFSEILTKENEAGFSHNLPSTKGIEEALVTPLILQSGIPEGNGCVPKSQFSYVHLILISRLDHNPMFVAEGDHVFWT